LSAGAADRRSVRRDLILLALLAAAILLPGTAARDLWNPNEPIYGLAAREMAERGDWLVPTVQGKEFGEKPILWFWIARAAGLLVGEVDGLAVRLPSALAAGFIVLGAYLLVLPYSGRDRAWWTGLLAATTFMVFWGGRTAQMDILVAATTLGVVLSVSRAVDGAGGSRAWVWAGVAAGLGFLAKGPVGWIVPGLVVFAWLASERRLRALLVPGTAVAAGVAIVVAAPWYVALALGGRGTFLHEVLIRQNFARFVDAWDHVEPWWYYGKYVWIDMAPWALLAPVAFALSGRADGERRLDRLAWAWALAPIVFFSLSESKRSAYILPIAPAVAILAAGVVVRLRAGALSRVRRDVAMTLAVAIAVVLGLLGAALIVEVPGRYPELAPPAFALGAVLLAGAATAVTRVFARRTGPRLLPAILVATVAGVYVLGGAWALPAADPFKSPRAFGEAVAACAGADGRIASYGLWDWRAGYAFYARRTLHDVGELDALTAWVKAPGRRFVVVERAHRAEVEGVLGTPPVLSSSIGSNEAHLFAAPGSVCATPP
jgi:4-amino-4-deoxy-L-arabinose transferase-like glycosyltransferase